jgi:hypothetical protein
VVIGGRTREPARYRAATDDSQLVSHIRLIG